MSEFTDLMGTAIANTESELRVELLSNEQAALRRVATLVAKEAPPTEIFAKVAGEAAALLGADCTIWRSDGEGRRRRGGRPRRPRAGELSRSAR